jgi:membrane associated rhomboid family serine protease
MTFKLTPAVKVLLIACFAMFIIQQTADQFMGGNLLAWFGLIPSAFVFDYKFWQIFTYPFLHGEVMHLFLNLMMLLFIGGELEATWGTARFLRYYFLCSTAAGLLYLVLQMLIWRDTGLQQPMVGASGAIYGLLMAYGLIFGERVLLFMMLFPMKAKHFVWILAGIEFMSTVFSGRGGLSNAAHLGGMVAGFSFLFFRAAWVVNQRRRKEAGPSKSKRKKTANHLKLIIDNAVDEASRDKGKGPGKGPGDGPKDSGNTWH